MRKERVSRPEGSLGFSPARSERGRPSVEDMSLTPTEERIAGLVALGHRNDEVAAQLSLSPKTIEWHLSRLYRKLGERSRTELSVVVLRGNPVGRNGQKDEPNGR
jgi:DNA-binding CsgD family transcriptional regulator